MGFRLVSFLLFLEGGEIRRIEVMYVFFKSRSRVCGLLVVVGVVEEMGLVKGCFLVIYVGF